MNIRLFFFLFLFGFSTLIFSQTPVKKNPSSNTSSAKTESPDIYIKILWLDNAGTLQLNEDYIKTITEQQRAVLGYIATDVGSECHWDGEKKADKSNLKCKLLSALNLGYQCSDTHLSFLKKWFKDDLKVLERLQYCNKTESSQKIQDGFVTLKMLTNESTIKIIYSAVGSDSNAQKKWSWIEESVYSFSKNEVKQTDRKNINGVYN
ncbi:hypothetical protein ASF10_19210 [Flavobacterium sp. Leaf82]|uniref:hypothetical protein n=1 Tax=unclassified Flavobacterium TaxID=196869 RepID=UPI0006F753A0|nr:hypothetical protein [Flavobacterium sp. Leaf82]KQO33204.1 hypothetical protein ASF10_19210 [Flavobacterium sp. Leaf82]